jgi:hypothetical protein
VSGKLSLAVFGFKVQLFAQRKENEDETNDLLMQDEQGTKMWPKRRETGQNRHIYGHHIWRKTAKKTRFGQMRRIH